MATPAPNAARARNAKKSTRPKALRGKERPGVKSLKHGMSAAIALLPGEDPVMFKKRMIDWIDALRPRNRIELYLAERAVYLSRQLDRAARAQSAGLCYKAFTAAEDREDRVKQEVADLSQRLFRISRGRPAAH